MSGFTNLAPWAGGPHDPATNSGGIPEYRHPPVPVYHSPKCSSSRGSAKRTGQYPTTPDTSSVSFDPGNSQLGFERNAFDRGESSRDGMTLFPMVGDGAIYNTPAEANPAASDLSTWRPDPQAAWMNGFDDSQIGWPAHGAQSQQTPDNGFAGHEFQAMPPVGAEPTDIAPWRSAPGTTMVPATIASSPHSYQPHLTVRSYPATKYLSRSSSPLFADNPHDFNGVAIEPRGHPKAIDTANILPQDMSGAYNPSNPVAQIASTETQQPTASPAASTPTPSRKRKRRPDETDEQAVTRQRRMRDEGSCMRCTMQGDPCDENLPCQRCEHAGTEQEDSCCTGEDPCEKRRKNSKGYRGPCDRRKLDSIQTFRAGDADFGTMRVDRSKLKKSVWVERDKVKTVKLQWPFPPRGLPIDDTPILRVDVHKFRDVKTRIAEEYTAEGKVCKVEMPAWACRDLDELRPTVDIFMKACQGRLEDEIRANIQDPLVSQIWDELRRYAAGHDTKLLRDVLQLFAGAMFNSRYPTPVEPNAFETRESDDPTPHYFKDTPLPPYLTFQIQSMVGEAMQDTQKRVIDVLKERILKSKKGKREIVWYETFLGIFGLLAMIQWVYCVQINFRDAHEGVGDKYHGNDKCQDGNVKCISCQMLDEWEESASILIAHFRGLMRSEVPFNRAWASDPDNPRLAGLGPDEIAFVKRVQGEVEERRQELRELRTVEEGTRYRHQLGFVCELFLGENR